MRTQLRHTPAMNSTTETIVARPHPRRTRPLRERRRLDSEARRLACRRRPRHRRRRPHVHRLRGRHRLPEHRPSLRARRRRDQGAGRRVPPPVLHGRRLRALRRGLPPPRRAVAVRRRAAEVDPRQLGRRGDRERRQDRPLGDRPARRRRLRQCVSRPHAADDDDDREGEAVQGRLRAVRARGVPRAGPEPVSRDHDGRRDRGAEAALQGRGRSRRPSRASCSSPCRGRVASCRCRPTILRRLLEICREHGILFVDDEVQSGVGRTGKMWAIEHYDDVAPDLLVSGKSIGGGLPLAAVTGPASIMDAVPAGGLGGTFGGNPLSCAAAVAVLDAVAEPEFLAPGDRARRDDAHAPRAAGREARRDRRGARPRADARVRAGRAVARSGGGDRRAAFERGLLLLACGMYGNVIRLLAPLTIDDAVLEEGLALAGGVA